MEQFIKQDSHSPNVHFFVILLQLQYFGGHVHHGATEVVAISEGGLPDVARFDSLAPAKVTDLCVEVDVQQDVFRLEISVDDSVGVYRLESL